MRFDRLARLTVHATRAPICMVVFGAAPNARVKGYAGPDGANPQGLVPAALHEVLMRGGRQTVSHGDVAGCALSTFAGLVVGGLWVKTLTPRTRTDDTLDVLGSIAVLVQKELTLRERQRPDSTVAKILESISDAFVFLNAEWRYVYVNRRAGEIFGRAPGTLVGKHIWTEFPEGVGPGSRSASPTPRASRMSGMDARPVTS